MPSAWWWRWCAGALCASALTQACARPPVSTALVVRSLQSKCALIAFSGCAAFANEEHDEDAGTD
jgi:hypothetical protein